MGSECQRGCGVGVSGLSLAGQSCRTAMPASDAAHRCGACRSVSDSVAVGLVLSSVYFYKY